jgi:hypothetical protein
VLLREANGKKQTLVIEDSACAAVSVGIMLVSCAAISSRLLYRGSTSCLHELLNVGRCDTAAERHIRFKNPHRYDGMMQAMKNSRTHCISYRVMVPLPRHTVYLMWLRLMLFIGGFLSRNGRVRRLVLVSRDHSRPGNLPFDQHPQAFGERSYQILRNG